MCQEQNQQDSHDQQPLKCPYFCFWRPRVKEDMGNKGLKKVRMSIQICVDASSNDASSNINKALFLLKNSANKWQGLDL